MITPELVQLGLVRAVPLLARSSRFDGRVSLQSQQFVIPIDQAVDTTGSAQLTLHQVRSVPTDPTILSALDLLGRLFKTDVPHELVFVDGSQVSCDVRQRQVQHDGVRAGLPQVDQRLQVASSGWVGLENGQLELNLEIPIPVEHLARRQSVKQLGVPSISLPIRGTLDRMELDWQTLRQDSVELLSIIAGVLSEDAPIMGGLANALSDVTQGNADQAIQSTLEIAKELWKNRQDRLKADRESTADVPSNDQQKRPLREALKNLLRGND